MKTKKVVLIDDETDIRLFFQTALEDGGYIALTASSAQDGLQLVRREKPDLICLDILMPEESGMSLYQKLKSDPALRGIPVMITSGLSLSRDLHNIDCLVLPSGERLPEPECIAEKPLNVEQFMNKVEETIGGAHG